jgi:hypothetical protein
MLYILILAISNKSVDIIQISEKYLFANINKIYANWIINNFRFNNCLIIY